MWKNIILTEYFLFGQPGIEVVTRKVIPQHTNV